MPRVHIDGDDDDWEWRLAKGVFITLFCSAVVGVILYYAIVQPKNGHLLLTNASIAALNVSTTPSLASNDQGPSFLYLNLHLILFFESQNPNIRSSLHYNQLGATLFFQNFQIGAGSIPGFYQPHKDTRFLQLHIQGQDVPLPSATEGQALHTSLQSNIVHMEVYTIAPGTVQVDHFPVSGSFRLRLYCRLDFNMDGNPHLLSHKCSQHIDDTDDDDDSTQP